MKSVKEIMKQSKLHEFLVPTILEILSRPVISEDEAQLLDKAIDVYFKMREE